MAGDVSQFRNVARDLIGRDGALAVCPGREVFVVLQPLTQFKYRTVAPLELELRLESVMEGVLVTGTARASAKGECVRCLEPLEQVLEADFQEMFSYPDADDRSRAKAEPADDAGESTDNEDRLFIEDGLFDLEPVLRDAVVLALPMQPVCQDDCPGLCSQCGARLADDPDHHHDAVDIRWAALQGLAGTIQDGEKDEMSGAEAGVDEKQEK